MSRDLIRLLKGQPTLVQRMRVASAAAGLTLQELAAKAEIHPSVLSRGIHGKVALSPAQQARLAVAVGVPESALFQVELSRGAA